MSNAEGFRRAVAQIGATAVRSAAPYDKSEEPSQPATNWRYGFLPGGAAYQASWPFEVRSKL